MMTREIRFEKNRAMITCSGGDSDETNTGDIVGTEPIGAKRGRDGGRGATV